MPGGGTSLDITTNSPSARLLDVTRLASRPGRKPTGVDRVELAYLRALLKRDTPIWGLARVAPGYVLLDRAGLTAFADRVEGRTPWGRGHPMWMAARRLTPLQRRAQSDLWRLGTRRALRQRLPRLLCHLPSGIAYLNVGHSNLTRRTLSAIRAHPGARITVMIHDTIPLDYPQYQRPESVTRFAGLLRRVRDMADLVLCNSQLTADDVARHLGPKAPPRLVAHLGVDMPQPSLGPLGFDLPADRPMFVVLGTIEPRKNHAFLLDIWDQLAAEHSDLKHIDPERPDPDPKTPKPHDPMPVLAICGARGWQNQNVFDRLDRSPLMGKDIFELPGLDDQTIASLIARANAMLFPSHAEGYGLPPIEAAMLGTPVISAPLPSVKEVLGELPVYLAVNDSYPWTKAIKSFGTVRQSGTVGTERFNPPTWDQHFNVVLRAT